MAKPLPALSSLSKTLAVFLLALSAAGCTTLERSRPTATFDAGAKWAVLPVANHTETPLAGQRAEDMLDALLRQRGAVSVVRAPGSPSNDIAADLSDRKLQQDAQRWAAVQGIRYGLTGAVDEWRYKVGVDGEPAVGLVLQVIDLANGQVVWSTVGAKSGWSREALSAVAQKLMREMLGDLAIR